MSARIAAIPARSGSVAPGATPDGTGESLRAWAARAVAARGSDRMEAIRLECVPSGPCP